MGGTPYKAAIVDRTINEHAPGTETRTYRQHITSGVHQHHRTRPFLETGHVARSP